MNLVITTAHNLTWKDLAPFVVSLWRTGHRGLVVFCRDTEPAVLHGLEGYGAWVIPYGEHPYLPSYYNFEGKFAGRQFGALSSVCYRFLMYFMFLVDERARWERVLMCDARDVVFQADPFAWNTTSRLVTFGEHPRMTLGACPYNSRWLKKWFPKEFEWLSHRMILCAGATYGTMDAVIEYCDVMVAYLSRLNPGLGTGPDQAIHNVLFHRGLITGATYETIESTTVRTVGYELPGTVRIDKDSGLVVNGEGRTVRVVHQYDRHPEVAKHLEHLWA